MDLFSRAATKDRRGQPLAERMRPRTLDEFVGQEHLLGPGHLLRRAIERDAAASRSSCGGRRAPARPRSRA